MHTSPKALNISITLSFGSISLDCLTAFAILFAKRAKANPKAARTSPTITKSIDKKSNKEFANKNILKPPTCLSISNINYNFNTFFQFILKLKTNLFFRIITKNNKFKYYLKICG